ncbi:DMT family transporter [Oceanobacillus kapialis]|uniref:DMT family transporter n=1 Tax=Oceanobacillus kapialis TaxID=481353 RepID=UPI00384DD347
MIKYYTFLCFSIILEIIGASFMKISDGFTHIGATLIVVVSYGFALVFYIILSKEHELGIVNALWAGGGTILIAVSGIILFQESLSLLKIIGVLSVVFGVIGLNFPDQSKQARKAVS